MVQVVEVKLIHQEELTLAGAGKQEGCLLLIMMGTLQV